MIARRRAGTGLVVLLFLVVGAAFLTQVVPYRQILNTQHEVAAARVQLADLEAENEVLQSDVDALQTETEIEKLARDKLGYVKPGEKAYVVLDPPTSPTTVPAEEATPEAPNRTWVERVWDFVTGGDLTG